MMLASTSHTAKMAENARFMKLLSMNLMLDFPYLGYVFSCKRAISRIFIWFRLADAGCVNSATLLVLVNYQ